MNIIVKWVLETKLRRLLMGPLKGYRTIIVMGASLLGYLLAWPELTQYVSPKVIASITAVVAIVLRIVTTTPVGGAKPPTP
jgi:hypothetical protein